MTDADRILCSTKEHQRNAPLPGQTKKNKATFKRPKALPRTTIPTTIRNNYVWLGREMDSGAPVYDCFSNAGRLRYQSDTEQRGRATDPGPSTSLVPASHKKVAYRARFRDMTYR